MIAQAAASQSIPIVTAYATLGKEGWTKSLSETNAKAVFLDQTLVPNLLYALKFPNSVKIVVYHGEPSESSIPDLVREYPHLSVLHYDELFTLGEASPVEPTPPNVHDLACIMYTSGSADVPKGVLLTHRNLIAARIAI